MPGLKKIDIQKSQLGAFREFSFNQELFFHAPIQAYYNAIHERASLYGMAERIYRTLIPLQCQFPQVCHS